MRCSRVSPASEGPTAPVPPAMNDRRVRAVKAASACRSAWSRRGSDRACAAGRGAGCRVCQSSMHPASAEQQPHMHVGHLERAQARQVMHASHRQGARVVGKAGQPAQRQLGELVEACEARQVARPRSHDDILQLQPLQARHATDGKVLEHAGSQAALEAQLRRQHQRSQRREGLLRQPEYLHRRTRRAPRVVVHQAQLAEPPNKGWKRFVAPDSAARPCRVGGGLPLAAHFAHCGAVVLFPQVRHDQVQHGLPGQVVVTSGGGRGGGGGWRHAAAACACIIARHWRTCLDALLRSIWLQQGASGRAHNGVEQVGGELCSRWAMSASFH